MGQLDTERQESIRRELLGHEAGNGERKLELARDRP